MAGGKPVGTVARPTTVIPKTTGVGATARPGAVQAGPGGKPIVVRTVPKVGVGDSPIHDGETRAEGAGAHQAEDIFVGGEFQPTGDALVDTQLRILEAQRLAAESDAERPSFFQPTYSMSSADGRGGEYSGPPIFTEDTDLEMSASRGGGGSPVLINHRALPRNIDEFRALPPQTRQNLVDHWGRLARVSIDVRNASQMELAFAYDYLNDVALVTCPEMIFSTRDPNGAVNPIRYGIHAHHYLTLREVMGTGNMKAFIAYLETNLEAEIAEVLPMISVGVLHNNRGSLTNAISRLEGTEYAWIARLLLVHMNGASESREITQPSVVFSDNGRIIMQPFVTNMTIGRSPDSDVVVGSDYVSGRHATIGYDTQRQSYYIDHWGKNPTFIHRDQRILRLTKQGQREYLGHGDIISLSDQKLLHVVIPERRAREVLAAEDFDADEIAMTVALPFPPEEDMVTIDSARISVPQPEPPRRSEDTGPRVIVDIDGVRHGRGTRPPRRSSDPNGRIRRGVRQPKPAPIPFDPDSASPGGTQGISAAERDDFFRRHGLGPRRVERPFDVPLSGGRPVVGRRSREEEIADYLAPRDPQEEGTQIVFPDSMPEERASQAGRRQAQQAAAPRGTRWQRFKAWAKRIVE